MYIYDIILFFDIVKVIQRREYGYLDFYLGWEKYKEGFGDLNRECWLGNAKYMLYISFVHVFT